MKKRIFALSFVIVSCVPSALRSETINLDRARRWSNCSFYVTDHDCGLYSDEETRDECSIDAQAEYLSQSEGRQRFWLRQHGCPTHIIDPI